MLYCQFYEIFKNAFFTELLRATASGYVIFWKLNGLLDYEAEAASPFEKHINPAQKLKFSIKDFFGKCDQIHADLVTCIEEMLNGKLPFLFSVIIRVLSFIPLKGVCKTL